MSGEIISGEKNLLLLSVSACVSVNKFDQVIVNIGKSTRFRHRPEFNSLRKLLKYKHKSGFRCHSSSSRLLDSVFVTNPCNKMAHSLFLYELAAPQYRSNTNLKLSPFMRNDSKRAVDPGNHSKKSYPTGMAQSSLRFLKIFKTFLFHFTSPLSFCLQFPCNA